jgi:hypothetical protein
MTVPSQCCLESCPVWTVTTQVVLPGAPVVSAVLELSQQPASAHPPTPAAVLGLKTKTILSKGHLQQGVNCYNPPLLPQSGGMAGVQGH